MALFRAIYDGQQRVPQAGEESGGEQFIKTLKRLRHSVHGGSTVVLLSDFYGFDETARKTLGSALNSMDMVAVHLSDPLDSHLPPPGDYPISTGYSGDQKRWQLSIGSHADRQRYADAFVQRQQSLRTLFVQQRHTYIHASTAEPILDIAQRVLSRQSRHKVQGQEL